MVPQLRLDRRLVLSQRERTVLAAIAAARADKDAALVLGLSVNTVRSYVKRIRAKYVAMGVDVPNRVALLDRAHQDGLIHLY